MKLVFFGASFFGRRSVLLGQALFFVALSSGCAYNPPAAWERGDLAKVKMKFDADRLDAMAAQHTYFSKEAASGGTGVGGGGCGCN